MKIRQTSDKSGFVLGSIICILSISCNRLIIVDPLPEISTEIETETYSPPPCVYKEYEQQTCLFPLTPKLDGDLDSDPVWSREEIHWETVHADMGQRPAENDDDASFKFACVADREFMYFGYRIKDNSIIKGESEGCSYLFNDDSIDIMIDQCSSGCKETYSGDGAQLMIMAENLDDESPNDIPRCELKDARGEITDALAYVKEEEGGWNLEIAVPLKPTEKTTDWWNIEPIAGLIIGFQTGYNDDDNGGDREHRLLWGLKDRELDDEQSWFNPTYLEKLMFCPVAEMGPDI